MATLADLFDLELFEEMKAKGFVKVQRHPNFHNELAIANYTQRTQINYHWNEVTSQTRGLIYNPKTLEIVARPFAKFFNHDEAKAAKIPSQAHVRAFDKVDGSLGVLYSMPNGAWGVATRGSFTSDQAIKATEMINDYTFNNSLPRNTMLFEIVYPENRIVVDYGRWEGLMYLGEIENETGRFVYAPENFSGTSTPLLYEGPFSGLFSEPPRAGMEGYVVHDERGNMVKIKYDEYVALHRVVTRLSERAIWEMMAGPMGDIEALVSQLPEEHATWAREVAERLRGEYMSMAMYVSEVAMRFKVKSIERKELALAIADEPPWVKACIFMGLDGKNFTQVLWKNIKPAGDKDINSEQKEETQQA